MPRVFLCEVLFPPEWDVTPFDDHVLAVLDAGFNHLADYGLQVSGQFGVAALGRQTAVPAAYEPHFQVVYRQVGVSVFLQQLLRQCGFASMRVACD